MCLTKSIFLMCLLTYVSAKTRHTKSLTESMGQEVIEIAAPIKELPQELEEEPSAENEDAKVATTTTIQAATKKEFIKTPSDPSKKIKDIDKIDGRRQDDDEARIEKELADIYKDSLDYKADSAEISREVNVSTSSATSQNVNVSASEKPIARAWNNFKFQPDSNDPREIARFRTSIDEISCDTKMTATKTPSDVTDAAESKFHAKILLLFPILFTFLS
ncbi:uncharacterized protein LOC120635782 [Pararge aegeria]|uniref:uncharacterized protein LOC120635782 n=1 Tax=Pararge aegeria TaxID=116150 RepID=UPI0019D0A1E0|nr:uncharacterized protein LOC120635782 [Pararge aegeria]